MQDVASGAFVVLIYLGFLVASRSGFTTKGRKLFRSQEHRDEAQRIFLRIREAVEGYVWVQTVTGLMIAAPAGLLMLVLGLSHAVFWPFLIFVASYIPVMGGAVGAILPPIFALLEFPRPVAADRSVRRPAGHRLWGRQRDPAPGCRARA